METTSYLIQKLVIKKPCKGRKHFGLKKYPIQHAEKIILWSLNTSTIIKFVSLSNLLVNIVREPKKSSLLGCSFTTSLHCNVMI